MKVITETINIESIDGSKVIIMLGTNGDFFGWRRRVQLTSGDWGGPMGHYVHQSERQAFDEAVKEVIREIKSYSSHWISCSSDRNNQFRVCIRI